MEKAKKPAARIAHDKEDPRSATPACLAKGSGFQAGARRTYDIGVAEAGIEVSIALSL
jgi:hypothetical protein